MKPPSRARWIAAGLCILYGFAKLNGSQFVVLDSELSRPMGDVSGYWLTWYYFGYSPTYGALIALIQIAGGILLTFRRTALAAALALIPVFANILLIDIFFRISVGATMMALLILGCCAAVIAPHVSRLRRTVLLDTPAHSLAPRLAMLAVLLVAGWSVTWLGVRYFKRAPTAIDGTWLVVSEPGQSGTVALPWREVFFERNQAHKVVFRSPSGDAIHYFEVGPDRIVRIWETLHSKGPLIMQGRVRPDGRLQLDEIGSRTGRILLEPHRPSRS
jgi:hypothetical protein